MVWSDSREIGLAAAECSKSGKIYVVARYKPSGNVIMTPPVEKNDPISKSKLVGFEVKGGCECSENIQTGHMTNFQKLKSN